MAAGEDQPQPVVVDRRFVEVHVVVGSRARGQGGELPHPRLLRAFAAQAIQRAPLGGRRQPRRRIGGHAVARPGGRGDGVGVLQRLFGAFEVAAEAACEPGEDRATLAAGDAIQLGVHQPVGSTGRTSTEP
jgi:hypothetical protein